MTTVNPLNNSSAKQQFSFSKSQRFPDTKVANQMVAYGNKSAFDVKLDGGAGRPFFHTSTRFDYYRNDKKEVKSPQPSPIQYKINGTFGP
mmetsp:Transcript_1626/g.2879  ORF Transcript_1626/g.2879 Transcript_1626/m.2879 type:complete len:90 (+) Transcript_1626:24-293(+)